MTAVLRDMRGHRPSTYVLGALICALNVYDAAISRRIAALGGSELNPLMKPIFDTPWFWVVKIGVPIAVVLFHLYSATAKRAFQGFVVLSMLFAVVAVWNTSLLWWRYPT
jgi:hypothetical protein